VSAAGHARKGRPDSLSEVVSLSETQSRPTPGTRPEVGEHPQRTPTQSRMFDQLAPSQEQKPRRFPVPALERRNTTQEPRAAQCSLVPARAGLTSLPTQRYDAVAPCGRTCSSPEEPRRQGEPSVNAQGTPTRQGEPPGSSYSRLIDLPHEATGFGRASSNPEEPVWRRQDKPPVLFSRLPTAPASFPSPQEEVKREREFWSESTLSSC